MNVTLFRLVRMTTSPLIRVYSKCKFRGAHLSVNQLRKTMLIWIHGFVNEHRFRPLHCYIYSIDASSIAIKAHDVMITLSTINYS